MSRELLPFDVEANVEMCRQMLQQEGEALFVQLIDLLPMLKQMPKQKKRWGWGFREEGREGQEGRKGEDKTRKKGERKGEESETSIFQRDETKERAMGG